MSLELSFSGQIKSRKRQVFDLFWKQSEAEVKAKWCCG